MIQEVVYLMAHLLITLGVLGAYIYSIHIGVPDDTLKGLLMVMGGYWFGAMGASTVKGVFSKKQEPTADQPQAQESQSSNGTGGRI